MPLFGFVNFDSSISSSIVRVIFCDLTCVPSVIIVCFEIVNVLFPSYLL